MSFRLDSIRTVKSQLRACLAQFASQLSRRKDWDIKHLACFEQLLGSRYDLGKLKDGAPELLLQIADASEASIQMIMLHCGWIGRTIALALLFITSVGASGDWLVRQCEYPIF